jgi:hypothetical protein
VIDDEIKALEEKCKKLIAEGERLRREHEALLNEMLRLNEETQSHFAFFSSWAKAKSPNGCRSRLDFERDCWLAVDEWAQDLPMISRIVIDCNQTGWEKRLEGHVSNGGEADLINFSLGVDAVFCVTLAECYEVEFRPSRAPGVAEATIRKPGGIGMR